MNVLMFVVGFAALFGGILFLMDGKILLGIACIISWFIIRGMNPGSTIGRFFRRPHI